MNSQFKCPSCRIVTGSNSTDFTVHTDDDRIEQNATSFKLFLFTRNEYLKALVEHDQKVAQAHKDVDKFNSKWWNRLLSRYQITIEIFDTVEVHYYGFINHQPIVSYTKPFSPHCTKINYKYIKCPVCKHKHYIGG